MQSFGIRNKIKSYCKINLFLKVEKKLKNNYHKIQTLITFCDLYDTILIYEISGFKDKIIFCGEFKKKINSNFNTVTKILHILRKEGKLKKKAFKIFVKKNIPHGSGLGGGSANASSLLNYFNTKYNLRLTNCKLVSLARQVGYDTPITLIKKCSYILAYSRKIIKLKKNFKLNILIVFPKILCSTKKIYSKNKNFSNYKSFLFNKIKNKKQLIEFLKNQNNDLEQTVINTHPKIKELIDFILRQKGCYFSRITGSGSACIGIFSSFNSAITAKKIIKRNFPNYWLKVSKTI